MEEIEDKEKVMTVKEVAGAMGVSVDTVKNCIRRLFPNLMKHGKTTYLDDIQVACISRELKNNVNVTEQLTHEAASQVKNTVTDLEILANVKKTSTELEKNQTINVFEKDGKQLVSARELHQKLEITERFSNWFERVCAYGFEENTDYLGCEVFNALARQQLQDYRITIEMAKQICMLQRSEKGKLYREYFLKLEKAWNSPEAIMVRALQVANNTLDNLKIQVQNQQKLLAEQKPKVETYNNYLSRDKFCNFRDAANYFESTQTEFMALLKSKYIYKNSIGEYRAYSEYSEYFTLRPFDKGKGKTGQQLMLNLKGLEFFGKIYQKTLYA